MTLSVWLVTMGRRRRWRHCLGRPGSTALATQTDRRQVGRVSHARQHMIQHAHARLFAGKNIMHMDYTHLILIKTIVNDLYYLRPGQRL